MLYCVRINPKRCLFWHSWIDGFHSKHRMNLVHTDNVDVRKKVGREPPQYGDLLDLQKREYLAKRKRLKEMRKGLYLIFKPKLFWFRKTPKEHWS